MINLDAFKPVVIDYQQNKLDLMRKRKKMMSRLEIDSPEGLEGKRNTNQNTGFSERVAGTIRNGKELGQSISSGIAHNLQKRDKKRRKNTSCCGLLSRRNKMELSWLT